MIIKKEARKAKSLMNEFTLALAGSNSNGAKILIKSHFDFFFYLNFGFGQGHLQGDFFPHKHVRVSGFTEQ